MEQFNKNSMELLQEVTKSPEDSETHLTDMRILSNATSVVGLETTPKPVICEFCGEERYTEGINLGNRILWCPCGAEPCTCVEGIALHEREIDERKAKKQVEEQERANQLMREKVRKLTCESGMGERFLQRTFNTFIAETSLQKQVKALAQDYTLNFDSMLPKRGQPLYGRNGLIISGTKGTGKTHIAAAIANQLLSSGTAVVCMTERNLYDKIKRTYSYDCGENESDIRKIYETVPLLIIDDLGKEKASEWTLSTLYAIIDGRYERAMPTIITTNYDVSSLIDRITATSYRETADTTTAEAIIDRLFEMCESIAINGDSWRSR